MYIYAFGQHAVATRNDEYLVLPEISPATFLPKWFTQIHQNKISMFNGINFRSNQTKMDMLFCPEHDIDIVYFCMRVRGRER